MSEIDPQDQWGYKVDVRENDTGDVRTVPVYAKWSDEFSPRMYATKMCDCNLYGLRERGYWQGTEDHSMPPKRFTALRAHVPGGRVVELGT